MDVSENDRQGCIDKSKTYYVVRSKTKLFGKKVELIIYVSLRDTTDIKLEIEFMPSFGGSADGKCSYKVIEHLREELVFLEEKKSFLKNVPDDSFAHLIKTDLGEVTVNCAYNNKTKIIIGFPFWSIERELSQAIISELDDFMGIVSSRKEVIQKKLAAS